MILTRMMHNQADNLDLGAESLGLEIDYDMDDA